MYQSPALVLALKAERALAPWEVRTWLSGLAALSPKAFLAGGAIYLDLSWQRGREREAATCALSLAPEGTRARERAHVVASRSLPLCQERSR